MKKLLLISMLIGAMPLVMMAQDDDLYFVPKKNKAKAEQVTDDRGVPRDTYYSGSDRNVDEYNRMGKSSYEVIDGDTTKTDVIEFSAVRGVYPDSMARPDSLDSEDYTLTRRMQRFDDYNITDNDAFWRGYVAGSSTWGWHSPWYYSRYGWYGGWYDPWYYGSWYGWANPWFYGYYDYYYGWYNPWYMGYYGYYGWGWPYYYGYYGYPYYYGGGGNSHYYGHTGNAGTINRNGSSHGYYGGGRSVTYNSQRMGSLRERAGYSGRYNSGNSERSGSGNFSGRRASGTYNNPSRSSSSYTPSNSSYGGGSGSFGGGSSSRGSGGGFSGGHSGGGGGGSRGGRR